MISALFWPSLATLAAVFTAAGLAIFSAHIPYLARLTGAAPLEEDQ
ncbi:MAG TPA: hypothetical protein VFH77_02160 [Streptomyces sp.]|nr:hypothetical protein [Streptomyces sp.]